MRANEAPDPILAAQKMVIEKGFTAAGCAPPIATGAPVNGSMRYM